MGMTQSIEEYEIEEFMLYRLPYSKKFNLTEWDFCPDKNKDYWFSKKKITKIPNEFYNYDKYLFV